MLSELHIENLGVIEHLDLVLGPGLTAVTGETGAGKTMIVEAIELLVGGRADSTVVRHGAPEARVDGRFVTPDGREMVLSRVVPADGRSRAYVDGRLATVASMAEAAGDIVDLHGQHAHQSLLSVATQRAALDRFGDVDLTPLRDARARSTEIDAALAALGGDERARARARSTCSGSRSPSSMPPNSPIPTKTLASTPRSRCSPTRSPIGRRERRLTRRSEATGARRDAVARALAAVTGRRPFDEATDRLHSLLAELDDLAGAVRDGAEAIEESPERLDEVRARRQLLVDLRRKYGDDLQAVMEFHAETEDRLRELESYEQRAAELQASRTAALADERRAAAAVGTARRAAAGPLAEQVQTHLRRLAMPDAAIAVEVGEHADDHPGDRVNFLLAANPGAPVLPLTRVASGGELARAMLALRLVLSSAGGDGSGAHTLVFDEVDAGIGGAAAQAVGDALAGLAQHHQVLVVTHLAQVAAAADAQVSVAKTVHDGATFAAAVRLDDDERVDELARMLSGSTTESAREHARANYSDEICRRENDLAPRDGIW